MLMINYLTHSYIHMSIIMDYVVKWP